jgi:hypothetical protein
MVARLRKAYVAIAVAGLANPWALGCAEVCEGDLAWRGAALARA